MKEFIKNTLIICLIVVVITIGYYTYSQFNLSSERTLQLIEQSISQDNKQKELIKITYELTKYIEKHEDLIANIAEETASNTETIVTLQEKPSYDYLKSVTVFIRGEKSFTPTKENVLGMEAWSGTGIVIKEDEEYTYILTNRHVANYSPETKLTVETGEELEFIAQSDKVDLALLRTKNKLVDKQVIIGAGQVKQQDKVYMVGHPLGKKYLYGEGIFAGYTVNTENNISSISAIIQVPVLFGNSGSGVFNSKGELIGMVFAFEYSYMGIFPVCDIAHGLVVRIENIKDFLEGNNITL